MTQKFAFTKQNQKEVEAHIAKYPEGRAKSAVMPLLWIAQRQNGGHLSREAVECVAETLSMPEIRVYEVASFYSMYNLTPVGENFVQVCQTTPCWLRGSDEIEKVCSKKIGAPGAVTKDGKFSWTKVECLGGCVNAPVVQINDDYYEDLDAKSFEKVLNDLEKGKKTKVGTQNKKRVYSDPQGKRTTLLKKAS